jgi:Fe2+ transport system protein FeoA
MAMAISTQNATLDGEKAPHGAVPLSSLQSGLQARVEHRSMAREDCELLAAMGLTDRCMLRVCRAGEPCIIQVACTRLGLSAAIARKVLVAPTIGATDACGARAAS